MGKLIAGVVAVLLVLAVGGMAFFMMWEPPAPVTHIEKPIPDARLPR